MASRLAGILLVVVIEAVGGFALGPHRALLLLAVPTTFAMPVLAAIAEWRAAFRDPRPVFVLLNALIIVVAALTLTTIGGAVVGGVGVTDLFSIHGGHHIPTFPYVVPLGALTYVTFLQISVVSEGRSWLPRHFGSVAGPFAIVACLAFACGVYLLGLNWHAVTGHERRAIDLRPLQGPLPALDVTAWLIALTAWQAGYNLLGGWPLNNIRSMKSRLPIANVTIIALGTATYVIARDVIDVSAVNLEAGAAMFAAGSSLVFGFLDGWPFGAARPVVRRSWSILAALGLAALGDSALRSLALAVDHSWTTSAPVQLWLVVCGLNLVGGGVLFAGSVAGLGPASPPGGVPEDVVPSER